jgi:hypothetical protein
VKEVKALHRQAMERTDLALAAKQKGEMGTALVFFQEAFDLESKAALLLLDDLESEPTRSVLFRSAATLALDCNRIVEAERLIFSALIGRPPAPIAEELRDLLEQVNSQRQLDLRRDLPGLSGTNIENDVERAILSDLAAFILEQGRGFAFVARQKRISVNKKDYYVDLLFYNRRLQRLVAIDLKLDKSQAAAKGQMEIYLRWLEKHDTRPGEEPPLGLILRADASQGHVELFQLDKRGVRVAQYLRELPPRASLEKTLHDSFRRARERRAIATHEGRAEARPGGLNAASPRQKRKKQPKRAV